MTVVPTADPTVRLAAEARSVLARPAEILLTVGESRLRLEHRDGIVDVRGEPSLAVPAESTLVEQADRRDGAQLRVRSGLDGPGDPARRQTLTLSGHLERIGTQDCACCDRERIVLALRTDFVLLTTWPLHATPDFLPGRPQRVELTAYRSPRHDLSRGYLQTMAEHATGHHHDELVARVRELTGRSPGAVAVRDLTAEGLGLDWVDDLGGHRRRLPFEHPARTRAELSAALSSLLGLRVC